MKKRRFTIFLCILLYKGDVMENAKIEKVSLTENFAGRIAKWAQDPEKDHLKYLKVKLGLETLFINVSKMIVVYVFALLFGVLWQVFVFNVSYILIRRFAGGIHAPNSLLCSLLSVITFIGIPYIVIMYALPIVAILVAFVCSSIILYLCAPYISKKNGDIYKENKRKLRNQSLVTCFILLGITLLVQDEAFQTLVTSGVTFASVLTIQKKK